MGGRGIRVGVRGCRVQYAKMHSPPPPLPSCGGSNQRRTFSSNRKSNCSLGTKNNCAWMHGISMMNEFCWNKYNKKFLGKFLWTLNILRTETLSIFSVFAEKENYTKRKVWHTLYLCFYVYEATFVPLLPKILPNNSKRGRKKYLCRGILVAVLPLVLAKSGIKGAWKTF